MRVEAFLESLPVRHMAFTRALKREFARCLSVLGAYAVMHSGVRFIVANLDSRLQLIATTGTGGMAQAFAQVFGIKHARALLELPAKTEHLIDTFDGESAVSPIRFCVHPSYHEEPLLLKYASRAAGTASRGSCRRRRAAAAGAARTGSSCL